MTSSTWNSEAYGPLRGVGVDAEQVARFDLPDTPGNPLPMVFSPEEAAHAAASGRAAWCLCAAFCVKEAMRKALGEPLDPRECRAFADPGAGRTADGALRMRVEAGPGLRTSLRGASVEALLREAGGELVATVVLAGP